MPPFNSSLGLSVRNLRFLLIVVCLLGVRVGKSQTPGNVDSTFPNPLVYNESANGTVYCSVLQEDGKIIVGGNFSSVSGVARKAIARLNPDGSVDASFNPGVGVSGIVYTLAVQMDGKVVVGGDFLIVNNVSRSCIARLNANGSVDTGFNPGSGIKTIGSYPGATPLVSSVVVQPDGKIVVGGDFTSVNGVPRNYVARLNANGSVDSSFNPSDGIKYKVFSLALQTDGKIVVGSGFTYENGIARDGVARLNADGSVDSKFSVGPNTSGNVYSVVVLADGKIVVGGALTWINGWATKPVLRLNADGSEDAGFNSGPTASPVAKSVAVQADGKIVYSGHISFHYNPDGSINSGGPLFARVNSDGSANTEFSPNTGTNSEVYTVVLQKDGRLVIGGRFASVNGVERIGLARLLGDPVLPSLTSNLVASGQIGSAFNYQTAATNAPNSYSASGLPGGLSINSTTGLISGTTTQSGIFNVNLSATNSYGTGAAVLVLAISNTFSNWQTDNFTADELANPASSGPLGDASGTGVTNLIKYALGIPPKRVGVVGLPTVAMQNFAVGGSLSTYLTLTYTRNKLASGIGLAVQASNSLLIWGGGASNVTEVSRTDNGDGTETVVTRDNFAKGSGVDRHFLRLQVTQP